jgi:hypothetical protein
MNILTNIALVLLILVGFSVGRTSFALKYKISPLLIDLPVSFLLWIGAFLVPLPVEKGLKILIWFVAALLVGSIFTSLLPKQEDKPKYKTLFADQEPQPKSFRNRWKNLSIKMGDFQGRLLLMWLFFILVLPFGVLVRLLSDPLHQKQFPETGWRARPAVKTQLDDLRRQF